MQAIVLSRRDIREHDQIISLYTREKGKLEVLARGVKKIISKNSAHLEPFSVIQAEIVRGKEIDHLTKAVPIDFFPAIRKDLVKAMSAWFVVSLVDKLLHVHEPDLRIWQNIRDWLLFVERVDKHRALLVDGLAVKLFHLLGFAPVFSACVVCGKSYADIVREELSCSGAAGNPGFYFRGGGLVCAQCRVEKQRIGEQIFVGGICDISNMQMLLHDDWRTIANWPIEEIEERRLHTLVFSYVEYHSERKIGDWGNFLENDIVFTP